MVIEIYFELVQLLIFVQATISASGNNPLESIVVNIDVFKKNEMVGIKSTNKSVFLYLAEMELIKISRVKKNIPMKQIPTTPPAATPSVKKKLAFAFCEP